MQTLKAPRLLLFMSVLLVVALIVLVKAHLFDIQELGALIENAKPMWLIAALVLQALTYLCVAMIWYNVCEYGGEKASFKKLTKLALEKFSIDQLLHVGGVAGRILALEVMQRMGISGAVAIEALIIDTVSYYAAFALLAIAVLVLTIFYHVPFVVPTLLVIFIIAMIAVIYAIYWLVWHKDWQPPRWIAKMEVVQKIRESLGEISMDRVHSSELVAIATFFQICILILDALTLWVVLYALGIPSTLFIAFLSFSLAAIAAIASLLPGGIGSFEAANTAALSLLGVPFEAALAVTLLLRGFTLWLPMIPSFILAHRDLLAKPRE